ncbi:MAG: cobalamin-binding protein [Deltaproteobacteria bacterium]|nr:cobalamin-binding protein [Deltaproteobacteria bacterium]
MTDDLGREVALPEAPRRIVSLVPSLTETLFALGAGPALVGVTRWCEEPAREVAALPKVGGTKNPDVEAIAALAPDVVVLNAEENRREDFTALTDLGIACFVTEPKTIHDGIRLIARLGALVGRIDAGAAIAAEQERRVRALVAAVAGRPPARYFCPIWRKPWMSFNADTYAHDMLRAAGGANVCAAARERYPTVTLAEIAAAAPEVVLLPDEPYRFTEKDRPALAPLAGTPAFRLGRVHFVDGKALAWYGPRIADGLTRFAAIFSDAR